MADRITILRAQYDADIAAAREAGAAEVRARVEAELANAPGALIPLRHRLRAALNGGES